MTAALLGRTRRLVTVGLAVSTAATGLFLLVPAGQQRSGATTHAAGASGLSSPEVVTYYTDLQKALGPLLVYVRILPGTIRALQSTNLPITRTQVDQAGYMAENFATARDLVGRLAVPKQTPSAVGELIQVACQLYRQSALGLTELKVVTAGDSAAAVLRRVSALHELGDRVIDQVRRLLAVTPSDPSFEIRYADPVPTITSVTGQVGPFAFGRSSMDADLVSARHILQLMGSLGADAAPATATQSLTAIAARLQYVKNASDEDVISARIAILLALLAADAQAHSSGESAPALLMLASDVWTHARTLAPAHRAALKPLGPTQLSRAGVWTGGVFNGSPPPLKAGEDVGSGVPGGLPAVNKSQILKD